jgi:uncharacterized protein (DUF1501 family)
VRPNPLCTPSEHRLSRRQWLGRTAGAALAVGGVGPFAAPAVAEALAKKDRQVLFIWIDGGISQLETWDPKPNTQFGGPFRAIPTSVPGIHISELMPRTAKLMHHLALVRSLCTKDNSHSAGVDRIQRGDPKNRGVTYPLFGSAVAKLMGPGRSGLPPYVSIKPYSGGFVYKDAGFLGPKYGAIAFGDGKPPENFVRPADLAPDDDTARNELRAAADRRYAASHRKDATEAVGFVHTMADQLMARRELFDVDRFSAQDRERYAVEPRLGQFDFGRHMLLARSMLEAGVRFVKVTSYGWDTHGDHFNGCRGLVPRFDRVFSSVIEDLHQRGMLEHVLVIAISEFGRTPRINGHLGRDHWPEAWSVAMAGAGLKKGVVHGKTNEQGTWVAGDEHDIGHLFHTWFRALGVDPTTEYDNAGQPLPVAHEDCKAVTEVLA